MEEYMQEPLVDKQATCGIMVLFFIVPHSLNLEQRAQLQIVNNLHGSP